ncbi:hypothetical protein LXL04_024036 [Taraxacum kok-saghyz]
MAPKPEFASTSDNPKVTADNPIAALQAHMLHIAQLSTDTNSKLDQLIDLMTHQRINQPPPPPPPPPRHNNQTIRPPKILLPNFDDTNPLVWLFQANNYFEYYSIPITQRVALVVFYFIGDALSWYKHLANNHLLGNWQEFSRSLELRFGPSTYENHQATLFKLQQTTTVSSYQTTFKKISNCVTGLGNDALLNCFLFGLKTDIQNEIALHHPTSLYQAYGLAKLVEDKLHAHFPSPDGFPDPPPTSPPLLVATPSPPPPLPIKKLTLTEMQKRRAEGLCYNCPATYKPGHQCNPPKFLLLQSETDPPWPYVTQNSFGLEDKAIFQGRSIDMNP